jgi:hypothetical protein
MRLPPAPFVRRQPRCRFRRIDTDVQKRYSVLGVAAVAAVASGIFAIQHISKSGDDEAPATAPVQMPFIVAADSHGSVVFDLARNLIVGYDRRGKNVWQDAGMAKNAYISCLATCPDVVASGTLLDDGTGSPLPTIVRTGTKSETRPANDGDIVLAQRDDHTRVVLERRAAEAALVNYRQGKATQRTSLPDAEMPLISPAANGDLAIVSRGRSSLAVILVRRTAGAWTLTSVKDQQAQGACVGPGAYAVMADDHATYVRESSRQRRTVLQDHIGTCHVAGDGLVAETASVGPEGRKSLVRYWDMKSGEGWTVEGTDRFNTDISPSGTTTVLVADRVATIRGRATKETVDNVVDARYCDDGSLVLLHPDGTVSRR